MSRATLGTILNSKIRLFIGLFVGASLSIACCIGVALLLNTSTTDHQVKTEAKQEVSVIDQNGSTDAEVSFENLALIDSPSQHRKKLLTLLAEKDSPELITLIDESANLTEQRRRRTVQDILFRHLAEIDPEIALRQVWLQQDHRQHHLLAIVFDVWAYINLDAAVETATTLESSFKSQALRSVLLRRNDLSNTERNEIAQILGNEFSANEILTETEVMQLLDRPNAAWNVVLNDDVSDDVQANLLVEIASAWISLEGTDGYVPLFQRLYALDASDRYRLTSRVIRRIVAGDPQSAWEQAQTLSSVEQQLINPQIAKVWASVDREQAFEVVTQIENSELQQAAYKNLIEGWSNAQPSDVLDNLQLIPPEHRKLAIDTAIHQLARNQSIEQAKKYIQDLEEQGENVARASYSLIDTWSRADPISALNWLVATTDVDSRYSRASLLTVIDRLALEDPVQAMEFARGNEFPSAPSATIKRRVISSLASGGRFESAKEMLREFQEPLDLNAYESLGRNLIEFDRGMDAIELAKDLPESRWADYFRILSATWFSSKPDELIENMERLPSKSVQSIVARQMLAYATSEDQVLSSKQIERLQTFLEVDQ